MHTPASNWKPATERDVVPERGIDFTLTPAERDKALLGTVALEENRRRLNREDTAHDLAVLLEQPRGDGDS